MDEPSLISLPISVQSNNLTSTSSGENLHDCAYDMSPSMAWCDALPNMFDIAGEAMDVIVIENCNNGAQKLEGGLESAAAFACSDFLIRFPKTENVKIKLCLEKDNNDNEAYNVHTNNRNKNSRYNCIEGLDMTCHGRGKKHSSKNHVFKFCEGASSKPTLQSLQRLAERLTFGRNVAKYILVAQDNENVIVGAAQVNIYKWSCRDRVIVSDIDGTITKSNTGGWLDTVVLERYEHVHKGICEFYSKIMNANNSKFKENDSEYSGQLRMLFLTSRPMSLAASTRQFLTQLKQGSYSNHTSYYTLPEGPFLCNLKSTGQVLLSEFVIKNTNKLKADILFRQVILPFAAAGRPANRNTKYSENSNIKQLSQKYPSSKCVLAAGFGNTTADCQAYEMAGIHRQDIHLIDKQSQIVCIDKVDHDNDVHVPSLPITQEKINDADNDAETNSNDDELRQSPKQLMAMVRRKGAYRKLAGTSFDGYTDLNLFLCLQAKLQL